MNWRERSSRIKRKRNARCSITSNSFMAAREATVIRALSPKEVETEKVGDEVPEKSGTIQIN